MSQVVMQLAAPLVTIQKYSEMVGSSVAAVRQQIHRGELPSIKQGGKRLVNVALVTKKALEAEL